MKRKSTEFEDHKELAEPTIKPKLSAKRSKSKNGEYEVSKGDSGLTSVVKKAESNKDGESAYFPVMDFLLLRRFAEHLQIQRDPILLQAIPDGTKTFKIISWNVNGFKALSTNKLNVLHDLVRKHEPDMLFLQETKLQESLTAQFA
jgi:hypothetical protein